MDCRAFLLNDKIFQKLDCHPQLKIFPKMDCRASSSTTIFPRLGCHLWQSFQAWIVVLLLCLAIVSKFELSSLASFPRLDCHTPSSCGKISKGLSEVSTHHKFRQKFLNVDCLQQVANFPKEDCRSTLFLKMFQDADCQLWQYFPKRIVA